MKTIDFRDFYLEALLQGRPIEGGIKFSSEIDLKKLDMTLDSLKYIDNLLDKIRTANGPKENELEETALQNFLYALCFYAGEVLSVTRGENGIWMNFDELMNYNPQVANMAGGGFWCSISVRHGDSLMFPLNAITTRLFEGPDEKSVHYSVMGFVGKTKKTKRWYQFWR